MTLSFRPFSGITKTDKSPELLKLQKLIDAYFNTHKPIEYQELLPQGTDFQQRVWKALKAIPFGRATTYADLARQLKTHPRAIGQACKSNPWPLIIPCHRVVSKSGLGGYSGHTHGAFFQIKPKLLAHEAQACEQ